MIIRIVIQTLVMCFLGWLLCNIQEGESYTWYSGIWHGLFLPNNFVRSLFFKDVLYKAEIYNTSYLILYWIFAVISVLSYVVGNKRENETM